jgi:hypothetical protein
MSTPAGISTASQKTKNNTAFCDRNVPSRLDSEDEDRSAGRAAAACARIPGASQHRREQQGGQQHEVDVEAVDREVKVDASAGIHNRSKSKREVGGRPVGEEEAKRQGQHDEHRRHRRSACSHASLGASATTIAPSSGTTRRSSGVADSPTAQPPPERDRETHEHVEDVGLNVAGLQLREEPRRGAAASAGNPSETLATAA